MNTFDRLQQLIDRHDDAVVVTLADGKSAIAPEKAGRHIQFVMEVAVMTKRPLSARAPFFTPGDHVVLMEQVPQFLVATVALCAVNLVPGGRQALLSARLPTTPETAVMDAVTAILAAAAEQDDYLVEPESIVPAMDELAYGQVMDILIGMFNALM